MKLSVTTAIVSVLGAALIGLLVYGISTQAANRTLDEDVQHGEHPTAPLAQLSVPALSGDGHTKLAAYRGKVVLLNFWASWCTGCQEEAKLLERAQHELVLHDATVLGVTWEDPTTDSLRFVKKYGLTFPNYHDANGELVGAFGTRQLPESFVIDRKGDIVQISRGEIGSGFVQKAVEVAKSEARTSAAYGRGKGAPAASGRGAGASAAYGRGKGAPAASGRGAVASAAYGRGAAADSKSSAGHPK
jgi:peroxiredoxin